MKRLFGNKAGRGLSPLEHGVKGGRIQTLVLRGVADPLGDGGDLQIWDTCFRGLFDDGVVDHNGNSRRRLRQFMAQNGPTHPVADDKTGQRRLIQYVFGHLDVAIHRSILQRDTNECGSEGAHALKVGLEGLVRDEFGDRLWKPELGIRVAISPHDCEIDTVLVKLGRGVHVPAPGDQPVAELAVAINDGKAGDRPIRLSTWKYYEGRPGHLAQIELPQAIFPGSAYVLIASQDELASVVVPPWGNGDADEVVRVGVDLNRRIGLAETRDGLMGPEILPDHPGPGVDVYRFEQPGLSPIPGCQPPSLTITIRQLQAAPAPPPPSPPDTPPPDIQAGAPILPAPPPTGTGREEEPTIVVGPRPGTATALLALEVVAIALPRVDPAGEVAYWSLQIDADGDIRRGTEGGATVLRIGASAARPGLSMALPGHTDWHGIGAPAELPLAAGGTLRVIPAPAELAGTYLGFLELAGTVTLTLPAGRHIFGRSGRSVDNKLAIGLLMQDGSLKVGGAPSSTCMEYLGLSRDHLTLCVAGDAIHVGMLGKTPAWRLDGDLTVRDELTPGSDTVFLLTEDDHLAVGPYLLRTIRL